MYFNEYCCFNYVVCRKKHLISFNNCPSLKSITMKRNTTLPDYKIFCRHMNIMPGVVFIVEIQQYGESDKAEVAFANYAALLAFECTLEEIKEMGSGFLPAMVAEDDMMRMTFCFQEFRNNKSIHDCKCPITIKTFEGVRKKMLGTCILHEQDKELGTLQILFDFSLIGDDERTAASLDSWCKERKLALYSEKFKKISTAEMLVLTQIIKHIPAMQIADNLSLSYSTIKSHKRKIFKKIEVHSIEVLIDIAIKCGLG
jgi:DNA-binding CsgD family transcriptional regulator